MKTSRIIILLLLFITLLSACGFLLEFDNLRRQEPADYYLFAPPNYTGDSTWAAFIFFGAFGTSGRDCLRTWMQYAEENEFILICPGFASTAGAWLQDESESDLVAILGAVAQEYNIKSRSFLAGFSAGGQFVIGYTRNYPNFVSAVSVISAGDVFTLTNPSVRRVPFLITIGDQDPNRIDLARDFYTTLINGGFDVSFYIIEGAEHEISESAINLTLQLFHRVNP